MKVDTQFGFKFPFGQSATLQLNAAMRLFSAVRGQDRWAVSTDALYHRPIPRRNPDT